MSNRQLILYENSKKEEKVKFKGNRVILKCHETGETIFEDYNKVVIAGSAFTAAKHWNKKPQVFTPSYNEVLQLENSVNEPYEGKGIRVEEIPILFALGTNGCGMEDSQVYKVNYGGWIPPEKLVPFRYQLLNDDISEGMRDKYFGRKVLKDRIAYYFKAFDSVSDIKQQFLDGTPIDENIYTSNREDEIETYVELSLSITKDDCRDFFKATTGINDAKINSLSILSGWSKDIDGHTYYQDIRPITEFHFPNENLIDLTKGIDIIYQFFY